MKKSALLRKVSADTGIPYGTVKKVMDSALDRIAESLGTGDRVVLSGFGTFALRPYRARQWVNPQTGRQIDIPAALRPGFITSAALKRRLIAAAQQAPAADVKSDPPAPGSLSARSRRVAVSVRQARKSRQEEPAQAAERLV